METLLNNLKSTAKLEIRILEDEASAFNRLFFTAAPHLADLRVSVFQGPITWDSMHLLQSSQCLRILHLAGFHLREDKWLQTPRRIQELSLTNCSIQTKAFCDLLLNVSEHIQTLSLHNISCGSPSVPFKCPMPKLRNLTIQYSPVFMLQGISSTLR